VGSTDRWTPNLSMAPYESGALECDIVAPVTLTFLR
jgi:hypothetical protein